MSLNHSREMASRGRFAFGRNWWRYLQSLSDARIAASERALAGMLGDLRGKSFLDVGCGSGLSSLAAQRLGADVCAFDFDPQSVSCALELQRRFGVAWPVHEGSALDADFLSRLGSFDIVYAWGVLHHTGSMWQALANMVPLVKLNGLLFVSIYNDQGWKSRAWQRVKHAFNRSDLLKPPIVVLAFAGLRVPALLKKTLIGGALAGRARGMSSWHDLIDWVGGYPFEVATPGDIFRFYRDRGFTLRELSTCGGRLGCNEYVFLRLPGEGNALADRPRGPGIPAAKRGTEEGQ